MTTWLEQTNHDVDDLQSRLKWPEFQGKSKKEQYKLLFTQNVAQASINPMSDRYEQLRDHTCRRIAKSNIFDWKPETISLRDIREDDLEALIVKDMAFMSDLNDTFTSPSSDDADVVEAYKGAYDIVSSVSRSIERFIRPSAPDTPKTGPLAGPESPLSDPEDFSLGTGATSLADRKQAAPPKETFTTGPTSYSTGPQQAIPQKQTFSTGPPTYSMDPKQAAPQQQPNNYSFNTGPPSYSTGPKKNPTWPNGVRPGSS